MFKLSTCVFASAILIVGGTINIARDNIMSLPHGGGKWYNMIGGSVEWEPMVHDGQNVLKFTLVGNGTGYVGVAISEDTLMGVFPGASDDCYYCSRRSTTSGDITITHAVLLGHQTPGIFGQVTGNYSISAGIADGLITCSFLRPISVTKNVSNIMTTWDVAATKYNLLFAKGAVRDDGTLRYHGSDGWAVTNGTFDLTDSSNYRQPTTTTMMTPTSSATAVQCILVMICITFLNIMFF